MSEYEAGRTRKATIRESPAIEICIYERRPAKQLLNGAFDIVRTVGLALPDVEATTKYDGSPVLKVDGLFMAGLATHPSAEPDTLVVRARLEDRERLVADAPEIYYLTDYYRSYPLVLVRLSRVEPDALHDLLSVAWRMTMAKARRCRPDESTLRKAGFSDRRFFAVNWP